jgi:hypothetical protein
MYEPESAGGADPMLPGDDDHDELPGGALENEGWLPENVEGLENEPGLGSAEGFGKGPLVGTDSAIGAAGKSSVIAG